MAGQLKEVRNRIKSVQSTQQITKAMKMVSAAKLRRAQDAIIQMRPYAQKLQELLSNIVSNSEGEAGMNLAAERPIEKVLFIVITSDRGLAGAFNANTIKLTKLTMLKDVLDIVQPPQKGKASFFKVLPDGETAKGGTWAESNLTENGKFDAAYTVSDITDSTIVVDFVSTSLTITKGEMMGGEITTRMTNKSTGKIILDKVTGIMKEKTTATESAGNTESSFGTLPVTSKTTITITVKPVL